MKPLAQSSAPNPSEFYVHVLYEIEMLVQPLWFVTSNGLWLQSQGSLFINVALESALVHARNLIEFFSAQRSYKTDIHVSDFDVVLPGLSGRVCSLFNGHPEEQRINWQVCHLTHQRSEDVSKKSWDRETVIGPLLPALNQFLTDVLSCPALVDQDDFRSRTSAIKDIVSPTAFRPLGEIKWAVATSAINSAEVTVYPISQDTTF
jgi:hypothetical protein